MADKPKTDGYGRVINPSYSYFLDIYRSPSVGKDFFSGTPITAPVTISQYWYMTDGPGGIIRPSDFSGIRALSAFDFSEYLEGFYALSDFSNKYGRPLPDGWWDGPINMDGILPSSTTGGQLSPGDFNLIHDYYNVGGQPDLRIYDKDSQNHDYIHSLDNTLIYGNSPFGVSGVVVVNADGSSSIVGGIRGLDDKFDFQIDPADSWVTTLGKLPGRALVGGGTQVPMEYRGEGPWFGMATAPGQNAPFNMSVPEPYHNMVPELYGVPIRSLSGEPLNPFDAFSPNAFSIESSIPSLNGDGADPFQYFQQFPSDLLNPNYFDDSNRYGAILDPVNYAEFGSQGGLDFSDVAGGSATGIAGLGYSSYLASSTGGFSDDWGLSYVPGYTSNDTFDTSDIYNYYNGGDSGQYYNDYNYDDLYNYIDYDYDYYGSYLDSYYNDFSDFGGYSDFGGDYGDWGTYAPVVLDLDNNGFNITSLTSSNFFFDIADDGHQHRTAWAGAGDGMLVYDADGNGQITRRNEVVFTDWSPGASSDMQALADVFDTNHNGQLDAGDTKFSSFKVMVTNADGTTSLKTLAELGITSINLTPDASKVVLPDGSTIDGQTTFTRSNGTTGKAATVTLAAEGAGYVVRQTVTRNADGSTTIENKALDESGGVAGRITGVTGADGKTRTLSYDNDGDGVTDLVQTDVSVTNADSSITQTLTNKNSGGVTLDRTVTTTSADGKSISIQRDTNGDTLNDQTESRVTAADGSTTITTSDLNPDGSLKIKTTSITAANGLTRTAQSDLEGNGTVDITTTDATVVNADSSRTQTVSQTSNNGALVNKTVTQRAADGSSKSVKTDVNGDGSFDLTQAFVIAFAADRASTTTETDTNADGSLRSKSVVGVSANGLSRTTQSDINGDGVFDVTTTDVTVVASNGTRTQTITNKAADGFISSRTIITKGADGISRKVDIDNNGDGLTDDLQEITVGSNGSVVETIRRWSDDGLLLYKKTTTTSADGLTVTTVTDVEGDGFVDERRTTTTVKNADGTSVVTDIVRSDNNTLLDKVVSTTSANGLSKTTQIDMDGNGAYESTVADVTVVNADSSQVQTVTNKSSNGSLLAKSVKTTSADRKTVTLTTDDNGDGANDQTDSLVIQSNGSTVRTVSNFNTNGSLRDKSVATASGNGLSVTLQQDYNGDAVYDLTTTDVTVLNADGSRTETVTNKNANNSVRDQSVLTTSANGFSSTAKTDINGDGAFDLTTTTNTAINANGSKTTTVQNLNGNGSLRNQLSSTVSDDGLSATTQSDLNGDGTFDRVSTDVTVLSADGGTVQTVTSKNGDGSLRAQTIITKSGDGRLTDITRDTNGDGKLDQVEYLTVAVDGDLIDEIIDYNPDGSVKGSTKTRSWNAGMNSYVERDIDGDGIADVVTDYETVIGADGSVTKYVDHYAGADLAVYTGGSTTKSSASGLITSQFHDDNGDGKLDIETYTQKVINADGSTITYVTHYAYDDLPNDDTVTRVSADGKTTTIEIDPFGEGVMKMKKTIVEQADGSIVTTITYPNETDPIFSGEVDTRTRSANGLLGTIYIRAGSTDYMDVTDVTVLNSDGSRTHTLTNDDPWGYDTTTTTSANGLSKTLQMTGTVNMSDTAMVLNATDVTVLNADGSTVQAITNTIAQRTSNATVVTNKATITTSDDGLTQTTQLDLNNDGTVERSDTVVTALDGGVTETITVKNRSNGSLLRKDVFNTSFDGRTQSLQRDSNGDGANDHFESVATNNNGSITRSIWNTNASGGLLDKFVTTTSANGLSKAVTSDINGDGVTDATQKSVTTLNADGSRTTAVTNTFANGAIQDRTVTTVSASGYSKTTLLDMNGDGVVDETQTDETIINDKGQTLETIKEFYADGSLKSNTTILKITTAYATQSVTQFDDNGDGVLDREFLMTIDQDGYRTEDMEFYNANGSVKSSVHSETTMDGLERSTVSAGNNTGSPDEYLYFMPNANGSYLWAKETDAVLQTATHTIDLNGVDTWVYRDYSPGNQDPNLYTVVIDLEAEQRAIETARRLYDTALDRTMGEGEVQLLAKYISNGVLDTATLANKLITSTEFTEKFGTLSNLQFVERIYQNALGRAPTLAELSSMVGQLNANTLTRVAALNAVSELQEHQIVGNGHMVTNNTNSAEATLSKEHTMDKQLAGDIVRRLYDAALDRSATASEVTTQSQKILSGSRTEAELAADILALPEFASKYGTLSNAAFVTQIFQNAIGRAPSSSESSFWTSALNAGTVTRADLLDGIAQTSEHLAIMGSNAAFGAAGNDIIFARDSATTIDGAAGTNTVDYSLLGLPGVTVNLVTGVTTKANGTADTLANIQNVVGTTGNDSLRGSTANNTLAGGWGNDTFLFSGAFGQDVITDFNAAQDLLQFDAATFSTASAAFGAARQVGDDVIIASGAKSVTLKSLALSELTVADFRIG
jgi:trimeric autotransporter adhesin